MIYALFGLLAIGAFLGAKQVTKKDHYLFIVFAIAFFYLEFAVISNSDIYSKLFYTEVQNCTKINENITSCQTYYDLNIDRNVYNFTTNTFYFVKLYDNILFEHSGLISFGILLAFIVYILYLGLQELHML